MRQAGIVLVLIVLVPWGGLANAQAASGKPRFTQFETPHRVTAGNHIDAMVARTLHQRGLQPAHLCSDAVFLRRVYLDVIGTLPTAEEARSFLAGPSPRQARRPDRRAARARRVRRLLGDEVVRSAAGQGGVPHQPLAQRRAGLPPLDPTTPSARTCRTTGSSGSCSPPAAATSACRRSTSTARCRARSRGDRPGGGPDVHGRADRELAGGPAVRAWRPSSRGSATSRPASGRRRSSSSTLAASRTPLRGSLPRRHER